MKEELQKLGLTRSESKIFELLVKYGKISGSQLAKKSGIDRSTAYNLLASLNAKGFVSYIIKDGLKIYCISHPENLKKFAEEKMQIADSLINKIKTITKEEPQDEIVEIYDGKNAPRVMYSHYLSQKNVVFYCYGGYGKMFSTLSSEMGGYKKKFKMNKNKLYSLISKDYPNLDALERIPGRIRQTNHQSISAGLTLGKDSVTFHIYEDESKIIMIKSPLIAKIMRELYELAWENKSSKEIN